MVIDTLELNIVVDNKGTTARINSTTNALKNLHKVITDINGAGGVNGTINGGGGGSSRSSGAKGATNLAKNLSKSLNFGSMVAKLYLVRNITKQLGQNLAKVVQYGIDYEETLNLWQTAMRGNISQARVFTSEMTKAYGISSATLMNYQATFKNMLAALGNISETTAYGLSEALTQMALDFSSLYNVSVESAMTKFQAVLSGQVRPIRTAGYDITEQTLFQLYQSIGGTKTVRQLNQTEKQLLRILAVYKQMERSGATGDLAKTITSSANQLRIMKEQIKEFATWVGVGFNTLLEKSGILVEINAWLYAGVALAKQFAIEMGYVEKDYSIDMDFENIENANKEVDELKGKLLGFDKFQVLTSAGTETEDVGIEQTLLDALKAYEGIINNAENPAFERSLEILKQIGLELDENGNIVGGFDKVKEKVTEITEGLDGLLVFIGLMTNPWMVLAGAIDFAYLNNEDFRNSINKMFTQLSSTGLTLFQALREALIGIVPYLAKIVEGFARIISWLNEMELLDDVIWLIVDAMLVWKAVTIAIATYKFASLVISKFKAVATFINTVAIKAYINFNTFILNTLIPTLTTFATTIKTNIVNALKYLQTSLQNTITWLKTTESGMIALKIAAAGLAIMGFMVAADAAKNLFTNWDDMSGFERAIAILNILAGAALVAAAAVAVFHTSWSVGVAAGVIAAGIAVAYGAIEAVKAKSMDLEYHADGGLATKGSLFYAGEAGPELVTQTSGGGSTIMNMQQLEDAVARGFIRGFAATDDGYDSGDTTEVYVDGQRLFNIIRGTARRSGYDFVKV